MPGMVGVSGWTLARICFLPSAFCAGALWPRTSSKMPLLVEVEQAGEDFVVGGLRPFVAPGEFAFAGDDEGTDRRTSSTLVPKVSLNLQASDSPLETLRIRILILIHLQIPL